MYHQKTSHKVNSLRFIYAFFFFLFLVTPLVSNAQNAKLSITVKNVSVKELLNEIEKKTNVRFSYIDENLDPAKDVTISINDGTVDQILNMVLPGKNLSFTQTGNTIAIKKIQPKQATAPMKKISGIVNDSGGEPIIGASIAQKGTTNGTITDLDGSFSLDIPAGDKMTISFLGYVTQEITIGSNDEYMITLSENDQVLGEVVVVGFGTQKKVNLTGAISTVKMEDVLGNRPVVSASQALQGAVPGLQVTTNTGKPGEPMKFNIRGTNRINLDDFGEGEPLVLVDNVPMDINMISPSDIETVTVLKDAASAAIYGARAAFGVILITTKQADKEQKVRINYNNNFAFTSPQSLIKKASPLETVRFYNDMGYKNGLYTGGGQNIADWIKYMEEYQVNPEKYPEGYYIDGSGQRYDLREVNHLDRMMDDYGFQQIHTVGVSGGTARTAFRASFGYLSEDGILVTDKDRYTRYNVSSFVTTEITPWLSAQVDVKYANASKSEPNLVSLRSWSPFRLAQLLPTYYPEGYADVNGETLPIGTPRWNIENSPEKLTRDQDIRIFGKATVKPFEGLLLNAEYTYNRTNQSLDTYNKVKTYANAEGKNFTKAYTHANTSSFRTDDKYIDYKAFNIYGNYDKTFGDHSISLMGGFNQEYSYTKNMWAQRTGVMNPERPSLAGSDGTMTNSDSYDEFALRGAYYRINYNYKGKYLLETNGRYDGSSKFPSGNRFGFFPSVSAGWRITEESFMGWSREYIDNLKLRISFGQVGNQSIKNYAYLGIMGTADGWLQNGLWNITRDSPALFSSNFTWEKVETLDFGFDINLLNNRLDLVFDWYQRDTKGMLAPGVDMPSVLGGSSPLENSADMRTKGWELSVHWRDRIGEDWRYNVGLNIYDSKSKITKFDNPTRLIGGKNYRTGMEIGEIWGLVTDRFYTEDDFAILDEANGIYQLKEGIPTLINSRDPRPGDILYKDLDGDGKIDPSGEGTEGKPGDRKIIGNTTRRYPFSFTGGIGWKGFDLSLFFEGVGKRDLWIGVDSPSNFLLWPHSNVDNPAAAATVLAHHLDYWRPDNRNAYYPRLGNQTGINQGADAFNRRTQTKYLSNAAYIKLKNITISYSFPQKWLAKTKFIQSFKIFVSGEDLWTKHDMFKGMDPEQTTRINDLYPFMKKYSFGFNITL